MAEHAGTVVVGGGATGTAVARDLALRGVDVHLLERGGLASGTSGHMHGLLHSGGRYADTDPASARDCRVENSVLREVAPHCVTATGGLFVRHPEDPADYLARKREACRATDIPTKTLTGREARDVEPRLAEGIDAALRVPDAVIDPFRLVAATAADAVANGATVETDAVVTDVLLDGDEVVGVTADRPGAGDESTRIGADHVVNAAGPWAGQVAALAGAAVPMRPAKGAMAAVELPGLATVVNRCRPRSEGDIAVPYRGTAILGTTTGPVDGPDDVPREDREVDLLRRELATVLPAVADAPLVEAYWGVRPLFDPDEVGSTAGDATNAGPVSTRAHVLLDHAERDGRPGLVTVIGGKLTTARAMGETVADHVCQDLGVSAPCRTADEPLAGGDDWRDVAEVLDDADVRLASGRANG